jgi:sugar transferase (PEP-CTERM/EpsH1 system associated)
MVPYLGLKELRDLPAVVDLVDVDSQKWFDYGEQSRWPWSWVYRTEGRRLRSLEHNLPSSVEAVTLVSDAEACVYRGMGGSGRVHAITNGVDCSYFQSQRQPVIEDSCVFVGALDYHPNVDAVCWFCGNVWPEILQHRPAARIFLVGRRPVGSVRRLANVPGVQVVGQVADVRPYLAKAAAVVAPLRIARGVQNKVLEALAMEKAAIVSPQGLAGLKAEPGTHVLSASTPREWVNATLRLFEDENLRQQLGAAGRRYVQEKHDWDRCLMPLEGLLCLATSQGQPSPVL